MAEKIDIELEDTEALSEEKEFQDAKAQEDKEVSEKEQLKEGLVEKKTEKQKETLKQQDEHTTKFRHLAKIVSTAWNTIAVPRGLEKVSPEEEKDLDEWYKPLEDKYNFQVSPELGALIGTGIVFVPKIGRGLERKKHQNAQGIQVQPTMESYPATFGEDRHPAMKPENFTGDLAKQELEKRKEEGI
jgi:hypothetical protein